MIQLFDSWAHHLGPQQFQEWSLPYVERVIAGCTIARDVYYYTCMYHWLVDKAECGFCKFALGLPGIRARHPLVPIIYFANGCGGKMSSIATISADVIAIDWSIDMAEARTLMPERVLQGNVDPTVLLGPKSVIESHVRQTIRDSGQKNHILNIGHGVIQGTADRPGKQH